MGVVLYTSGSHVAEAFGIGKAPVSGQYKVYKMVNDWKTRSGYSTVRGLWVSGADSSDYSYVSSYADARINYPYNHFFTNKTRTDAFYCSQLAWRAWTNTGFDIDANGGSAVWPVDIFNDSQTTVFYSKG
ncbi:hypothetical protein [Lihuaxuella thermophila]|uniref:hypothetical protein n=1 Tax=Lihuaxuella thermophila TaxID=1173111 RepID=UPI001114333C|nr:hypothetical protein [Lihuaxuella thermophila]